MSVPNPGEEFLARVGLGNMDPELRRSFLAYMYEWVQCEIGDRIKESLRDEQMAEFEAIMEGDAAVVDSWIAEHAPEYLTDARYLRIVQGAPDADEAGLRQEYVSSRWIEVVRPDFKEVTAAVWADVTQMIRENREAILAASLEE